METRKSRVSSLGRTSRNRTRENASSRQRLSVSSVASRILPSGSVNGAAGDLLSRLACNQASFRRADENTDTRQRG